MVNDVCSLLNNAGLQNREGFYFLNHPDIEDSVVDGVAVFNDIFIEVIDPFLLIIDIHLAEEDQVIV